MLLVAAQVGGAQEPGRSCPHACAERQWRVTGRFEDKKKAPAELWPDQGRHVLWALTICFVSQLPPGHRNDTLGEVFGQVPVWVYLLGFSTNGRYSLKTRNLRSCLLRRVSLLGQPGLSPVIT